MVEGHSEGAPIPENQPTMTEEEMQAYAVEHGQIPGGIMVLGKLSDYGGEIFAKVASQLGDGDEIYEKFTECDSDMDKLVERYNH